MIFAASSLETPEKRLAIVADDDMAEWGQRRPSVATTCDAQNGQRVHNKELSVFVCMKRLIAVVGGRAGSALGLVRLATRSAR